MKKTQHCDNALTKWLLVLTCFSFIGAPGVCADAGLNADFRGFFFGDLYHVPSHHTDQGDGASGTVLRRLLLTADTKFGDLWSGRARLEAYHEGAFENYEMTHRILDLGVTKKLGDHQLSGGLIPTITYDVMEALSVAEGLSYRVMHGAKASWEADKNPFSKTMGGITWRGSTGLLVDAYLDWESRPGPYDRSTVQFLVGKKTEQYTLGLEYTHQDRGEDPDLELATLMGVMKLGGPWSVMAQLHRLFKPSVKGNDIAYIPFDPTATATNLVAGVEYRFNPHFTLSPNIVWTHYGINELGVKPDDDVHLRLTFYVNFE